MKRILLLLLLSSVNTTQAQNASMLHWLDSAKKVYRNYPKIDSAKYEMLRRVAIEYRFQKFDSALAYNDTLIAFAKKLNDPFYVATSFSEKAETYFEQGMWTEAIRNLNIFHDLITGKKERRFLILQDVYYQTTGTIYSYQGDYEKSLGYLKQALDASKLIEDSSRIISAENSLGVLYMDIADWQTAAMYMRRVKYLCESNSQLKTNITYQNLLFASLNNLAIITYVLHDNPGSLKLADSAIEIAGHFKLKQALAVASSTLADVHFNLKNYARSYYYLTLALPYNEKVRSQLYMSMNYKSLGRILRDAPDSFLAKRKINPAIRFDTTLALFNKAIEIGYDVGDLALREDPEEDIALTYEKIGDYVKALEHYKIFKSIHDSLGNTNQQKSILVNDMQYRFGRKTDSLKYSYSLTQAGLQQQLLFNKQESEIAEKEKQLQKLLFDETQSALENSSIQNSKDSKELALAKKEKELQDAEVSQLAKDKQFDALKLKQQNLYAILSVAGLLVLSGLVLYNNWQRRKRLAAVIAKDKAAQQLKQAEVKNKMTDITLSALRSQMNPHFIFNCLNSIKLYTMENNTETASDYISKFAKLIRNMLDNSSTDRVTLRSELDAVKLYIQLEAMRFKNKLRFKIEIGKDIDTDFVEIPPLLLQPYIENAIWHGLMPRPEGGNLEVSISQDQQENLLLIKITDDGVGRVNSESSKRMERKYHKSLGTKVTGERIALINERFNSRADVMTNDLYYDEMPRGTEVVIRLPLE